MSVLDQLMAIAQAHPYVFAGLLTAALFTIALIGAVTDPTPEAPHVESDEAYGARITGRKHH